MQVEACMYVQQSESEEETLTVIKCLFTHFVKVFFCTRSRSSARHKTTFPLRLLPTCTAVNGVDALCSVGSVFLWDEKQQCKRGTLKDGLIDLSLGSNKKKTHLNMYV